MNQEQNFITNDGQNVETNHDTPQANTLFNAYASFTNRPFIKIILS